MDHNREQQCLKRHAFELFQQPKKGSYFLPSLQASWEPNYLSSHYAAFLVETVRLVFLSD